jgi:hypothetical protein
LKIFFLFLFGEINTIFVKTKLTKISMLLSISKYAIKCGCSPANIRARIKKKLIKLKMKTLPDKTKEGYIDTRKFPPIRMRKAGGGRKPKEETKKKKVN